ncbi:MAG: ComEC/Rec2 family competence protein [Mobilicoccus sp.]|nr:ComEC/Rec2 family competence protein [Mobilicoccus sp.]
MSETTSRPREAAPDAPVGDIRLLLPALVAWAAVVILLGRGPAPALAVAGGASSVVALIGLVALYRGRRPKTGTSVTRPSSPEGEAASTWVRPAAFGLLVLALLAVGVAGAEHRDRVGPIEELAAQRAHVRFVARVAGEPRLLRSTEAGPTRVVVDLRVTEITHRGQHSVVDTPVVAFGDETWLDVGWRQVVSVEGTLRTPRPGDRARATVSADAPVIVAGPGPVIAASDAARAAMTRAVAPLPADPRGLIPALVIGDRTGLPDDLTDAMVATGMSHLTAVSGTNCTLVVGAAVWISSLVGAPRRLRPFVGAVVLAGFVVLARPDPSVLRAAVMGALGLLAIVSSRRAVAMPALGGAIVVLLLVDPWLGRSFGFALSVLATLGLLLFARPWSVALRGRAPWLGRVAEALVIPLAAQVTCAPVIVLLQGEISVVGVLANALAAPLVAPATILGAVVAVLGVPWPWGATVIAWCAALPTWLVALIARSAEQAPLRAVPWRSDTLGALGLALLTVLVVLFGRSLSRALRRRLTVVVVVVTLAAVVAIPILLRPSAFPGPHPAVVMCDVGQGDAIVLMSGPARAVVVDTGPDPDALDRCLDALAVKTVDAVVLTHFDSDHVGGLPGLDRGRSVGDVVISAASLEDTRPAVADWWTRHGRPVHAVAQGEVLRWGQVAVLVRGPVPGARGLSPNGGSLVLDAAVANGDDTDTVRVLLLADADEAASAVVRADLRTRPVTDIGGIEVGPIDVVKVAHHGSADHDPMLMTLVAAPAALISVGEDNTYGHPSTGLLDSVRDAGSTVYRSDEDGAVALRKEDGRLLAVRERGSARVGAGP